MCMGFPASSGLKINKYVYVFDINEHRDFADLGHFFKSNKIIIKQNWAWVPRDSCAFLLKVTK